MDILIWNNFMKEEKQVSII